MKKLIDTLVNIWKIEDLRTRILNTLMFLTIYRLGSYVVLPGVNPAILNQSFDQSGLLSLLNMFAGGAFANALVISLGAMPSVRTSVFLGKSVSVLLD